MRTEAVISVCLLASAVMHSQAFIHEDHFDGPKLSNLWEIDRLVPNAVTMQSRIVRDGAGAIEITLRPRDMFEAGRNGNADSERDELMEARKLVAKQGIPYRYSWSMYLPKSFPIVPVRLVVAQWKQFCDGEPKPCDDDSPVLAVRYIEGMLKITQDINHRQRVLFEQKRDLRQQWLDLSFEVLFTPKSGGYVRAWLDGTKVAEYNGVTANPQTAATGYSDPSYFYFKMGLYRNSMSQPMTIYLDEYRKQQLFAPGQLP